jgi:hypothetical protein
MIKKVYNPVTGKYYTIKKTKKRTNKIKNLLSISKKNKKIVWWW